MKTKSVSIKDTIMIYTYHICIQSVIILVGDGYFLQTTLKEYMYIQQDVEESTLEMAEEHCGRSDGYHLLSINSHEEQQLIQALFHDLSPAKHRSTYYIFISLKKQVRMVIYGYTGTSSALHH